MDSAVKKKLPSTSRKSYSPAFKLEVAEAGLKEGKRKISRKYNVSESLVRRWIINKDKIFKTMEAGYLTARNNLQLTNFHSCEEIDLKVHDWFLRLSKQGQFISKKMVIAKATMLYKEAGLMKNFRPNFWYRKWKCEFITAQNLSISEDDDFYIDNEPKSSEIKLPTVSCKLNNLKGVIDDSNSNHIIANADLPSMSENKSSIKDHHHDNVSNHFSKDQETSSDEHTPTKFSNIDDMQKETSSGCIISDKNSSNDLSRVSFGNSGASPVKVMLANCNFLQRKERERYLPQFKAQVLDYARCNSFKDTAVKFNIHPSTVSDWYYAEKSSKTPGNEKTIVLKQLILELVEWMKNVSAKRIELSQEEVKNKFQDVIEKFSVKDYDQDFKWLFTWMEKLDADFQVLISKLEEDGVDLMRRNVSYPIELKVVIAEYAIKTSINAACNSFCIDRRRISVWVREKDCYLSDNSYRNSRKHILSETQNEELVSWYKKLSEDTGSKPSAELVRQHAFQLFGSQCQNFRASRMWYKDWCQLNGIHHKHEFDDQIINWVLSKFDDNQNISHADLQACSLSIICQHKPEFKSSAGWVIRFCKRNKDLLSSIPPISRLLTTEMEGKVEQFRSKVNGMCKKDKIFLACMDEIFINFKVEPEFLRKRSSLIRQASPEHCNVSVMIAVTSNGHLLPTMVIFKGEGDFFKYSNDIFAIHCKATLLSTEIFMLWLQHVWLPKISSSDSNILIVDSCSAHSDELFNEICHSSSLAIMPPGCSSRLQPIETKEMKASILTEIHLLMCQNQCDPTLQEILFSIDKVLTNYRVDSTRIKNRFHEAGYQKSSS